MKFLVIICLFFFPLNVFSVSNDDIIKKYFDDGKDSVIFSKKYNSYFIYKSVYLNKKSKSKKIRRKKRILEIFNKSLLYNKIIKKNERNDFELIFNNWKNLKYTRKNNRLFLLSKISINDVIKRKINKDKNRKRKKHENISKLMKKKNNNLKKDNNANKEQRISEIKDELEKKKPLNIFEIYDFYEISKKMYDFKNEMKYFKKINKFCIKKINHEICQKNL